MKRETVCDLLCIGIVFLTVGMIVLLFSGCAPASMRIAAPDRPAAFENRACGCATSCASCTTVCKPGACACSTIATAGSCGRDWCKLSGPHTHDTSNPPQPQDVARDGDWMDSKRAAEGK